jgi:hypothetical protein
MSSIYKMELNPTLHYNNHKGGHGRKADDHNEWVIGARY